MIKNILFQLHWFLGITAGTVLALMGITGATLSFEDELVRWTTPATDTIAAQQRAGLAPLTMEQLVVKLRPSPKAELTRFNLDPGGERLSSMRFKGVDGSVYFDPYSGQALPEPTLAPVLQFIEDLHRRLVAGEAGKQVTGACVIVLVFFCLSGLYLRWPRRWWSLREWWQVQWQRSGRSFLWSLHSVVGTWCLVFYLLIALTGLYWSYDWYRTGFVAVLGGEPRSEGRPAGKPARGMDLSAVQHAIDQLPGLPGLAYELRFPNRPGAPLTARYRQADAPHPRAFDSVDIDAATGQILKRTRYADQPLGRQLITSVFALHSGSFFGLPGRVLVMLASLCMPLFLVTGWMLYLDRRRKKRQVRDSRAGLSPGLVNDGAVGTPWLVSFASQSGFAEQLAWLTAGQLRAAGLAVQVEPIGHLDDALLSRTRNALFVLSTFGDGEAPDTARAFERRFLDKLHALPELGYAMLALGDRQYTRFCGFSRRVETWLHAQGARPLFPPIEVDRDDAEALAAWQQQLTGITGLQAQTPLVQQIPWQAWTLRERTQLNPGSAAGEIWHVALVPPDGVHWKAGDILQIAPCNNDVQIAQALACAGLAHAEAVLVDGSHLPLAQALATRALPPPGPGAQQVVDAQAWLDALPALPHREYSVASIKEDGAAELVVRLTTTPDGRHGLGSGWLCLHAAPGTAVQARIRSNNGFHRLEDRAPMLLIGNGTGIAGLRSLLREADTAGHHGHWLIFGERTARHDHLFADEMQHWQQQGHLARVDLAFSRDQPERRYVQHQLAEAATELAQWVNAGASLYVCGSLLGMAEEVDHTLRTVLGDDTVEQLLASARYRRDVY
ncbi:sulfite reductase flavoprotein subunit alpha [Pseudoxanthomonas sp.]|uniref:sulfite reductase flavoprotein subunit alpha n=1 Tax=Pseudoxanthomonas sp. TaxID=1871049 RepID=UPI00263122DE|nr:sulfite reductase flavoprotein subunit alpha [Pseudoxanthomonas sp.]WDS37020.1 MAG: sulfite reductase flavoprotein subunit alpha [Pseudoxanthomonas sp.]